MDIKRIESIDEKARAALKEVGICTTTQLLERAASPAGRLQLADLTHLPEENIKAWAYVADLLRVEGIGVELAEFLFRAGVVTVPKLAYRSADSLYELLTERSDVAMSVPPKPELERIIHQAKSLPKVIRH